jgi:regulatory protein
VNTDSEIRFVASLRVCSYILPVPPNLKNVDSNSKLYQAALRALMRRAHSVHEMREVLKRRSDDEDEIDAVIGKLKQQKYLDDARYALDFARFRARSRKLGKFRIARDLRARGVPDRHVQSAVAAVSEETDEGAAIRSRLQRVLKSKAPLDQRKIASLYRSLLRAGYSADAIRTELRAATKDKSDVRASANVEGDAVDFHSPE